MFKTLIKKYPCLWDPSNVESRNITYKARCRELLLSEINLVVNPPYTMAQLKTNIKSYQQELRRRRKNIKVLQDLTEQALPDETTGSPFYIIRADIHENIINLEGEFLAIPEQETEDEGSLVTTEASVYNTAKTQSETEANSTRVYSVKTTSKDDIVCKTEEETDNVETEESIKIQSDKMCVYEAQVTSNVDDTEANNEKISQVNTEGFKQEDESDRINEDEEKANAKDEPLVSEKNKEERKESGVNNIAEALINLEKEINDQQDQENAEVNKVADITEVTSTT